jgi:hypothetical protein
MLQAAHAVQESDQNLIGQPGLIEVDPHG